MGWMILEGQLSHDGMTPVSGGMHGDSKAAVFVSTTTNEAFGPVMKDAVEAHWFANWLGGDPRVKAFTPREFERALHDFRTEGSPEIPIAERRVRHAKRQPKKPKRRRAV